VFLGIALALNILWGLAAVLVSTILCLYILILPEERYLSARFGAEYRDYTAAVHRWLGRK
jgi:protein-S-isoprenylcysteine O-methyltransferase Ste14